jgi:hypothetical protein
MTYETEFELDMEDDDGVSHRHRLTVEIEPGDPGCYSGPPDNWRPADPDEYRVTHAVRLADGYDLTRREIEWIERWHDDQIFDVVQKFLEESRAQARI